MMVCAGGTVVDIVLDCDGCPFVIAAQEANDVQERQLRSHSALDDLGA